MTLEQGCTQRQPVGDGADKASLGLGSAGFKPSSKANPCPICGRSKDGDCRIGSNLVLCHHGSSHHPPKGLKPGEVIERGGQQWAFTGDTSDGRAATYARHKPLQPPTTDPPTKGRQFWRYSETFCVVRTDRPDGGKSILPLSWIDGAWIWRAPKSRRPMLLSHPLAAKPDATVLVVEGEKTWDAARRLFPGLVVCCWSGGCKAISKTDFTALAGRKVVLWPDNDDAGRDAMQQLAQLLYGIGADSVKVVANPNDEPQGWDLADADWTASEATAWVKANTSAVARQQLSKAASADDAITAKAIRLTPAQVMKRLPEEVGTLRLNTRSQDITAGGVVMSGNAIARLYLQLSSSAESWPKEATYDAAVLLAEQNSYDPVADYLNSTTTAPLPMEQWQRLDQYLLGTDDPIAAAFLPRYLIAAVARTFAPGCDFRQTPVLVGPQWIGKTALGRILFGAQHFISGVGDLGKDSLERCHTAWSIELAELDGITRRSDQEALKAFLSETCDSWRSPYDKATERRPRRFLFWGTSNGAALRDTTGNTRFVCIPVEQPLPLEWAEQNRAAIWSRAVEQYKAGVSWQECSAAERSAIADRNDNYQEQDPWLPVVMQHLEHSAAEQRLPVKVSELLTRIGVPTERQSPREAKRVQQLAESLGWQQDRRQVGGKRQKGLWPAATPLPYLCHTSATHPNTNQRSGSGPAAIPATPKPKELPTEGEQEQEEQHSTRCVGTYGQIGVAGMAFAPDANQRSGSGGMAEVWQRCGRGVAPAPAAIPGFIDPSPAPVGSGADVMDDGDDPHWKPRAA